MNFNAIIPIIASILFLLFNSTAYCDSELSYDDTVNVLKETMASSTSDVRKESYGYIRFNKCSLDYNVRGTYPVGDLYDIKFSDIDFSRLNEQLSKTGHDYTAFIILNFRNTFRYKDDVKDLAIHTLVVNVSNDEKAQSLFSAFLHLGKLCGTPKNTP